MIQIILIYANSEKALIYTYIGYHRFLFPKHSAVMCVHLDRIETNTRKASASFKFDVWIFLRSWSHERREMQTEQNGKKKLSANKYMKKTMIAAICSVRTKCKIKTCE